jgi:hypothetical protein
MKWRIIFCFCILCLSKTASCQLNVQLLHQLVGHNKDEYERQKEARDRQGVTTANEQVNTSGTTKLKKRYREIQNRFSILHMALQGLSMGIESGPIIERIIAHQDRIINIASGHPEFIPLALNSEKEIVDRSVQLGRYIAGLFLAIGDLNQMKASDRRLLYAHILTELRQIEGVSRALASTLYYSTRKKILDGLNPFREYINTDRRIVENILRQIEKKP